MSSTLYRTLVNFGDRHVPSSLRPLWESESGPKTIFFWAPLCKWVLVIASASDLNRPVEKISVGQTTSLVATGLIWARYSMVIKPVNYLLMSVNVFIAGTNIVQLGRVVHSRQAKWIKASGWPDSLYLYFNMFNILKLFLLKAVL